MQNFERQIEEMLDSLMESFSDDILSVHEKQIRSVSRDYALMVAKSIQKKGIKDSDDVSLAAKYVAEWTIRKAIVLSNSNISPDLWEGILKPVAGGVYELLLNLINNNFEKKLYPEYVKVQAEEYFKNSLYYFKKNNRLSDDQIACLITTFPSLVDETIEMEPDFDLPRNTSSEWRTFFIDKLDDLVNDLSSDVSREDKQIVFNKISIIGDSLCRDLSDEQHLKDTQIEKLLTYVVEWTFRKAIILVYSDVPTAYWQPVLQKVAESIFRVGKNLLKANADEKTISKSIMEQSKYYFKDSIYVLQETGQITYGQLMSLKNL